MHPSSKPETQTDSARTYRVAWVEPTAAPKGAEGDDWYRYALEGRHSILMGWRRGSLQEITAHAAQYAEALNARSTDRAPSWLYRQKKAH